MSQSLLPPGPKSAFSLTNILAIRRNILNFLAKTAADYGDISYFKLGPIGVALLNHPDHVKDVLTIRHRNFHKGRPLEMARKLLGAGLLTSEGEYHSRQWRMIQPAFHRKRIDGFGAMMTDLASRWGDRWQDGVTLDIATEMMNMSTAIAGKTMFNANVEEEAPQIVQALADACSLFPRIATPYSEWLLNLPLPSTFRFYKAKARLDDAIYRVIADRRRSGEDHGDVLSLLLMSINEVDGTQAMSDRQVRDEALTLFLTAFDTTSLALTWTWHLLSGHSDVESELHAALDGVLGGRIPTAADLPRLTYVRMVLTESMRLYPPLYVIAREALADFEIGGFVIPAGTLVLMSPYLIHRDARFYPDAERFDPHRWSVESVQRQPFTYFPFGGGPRGCIGESYAWMEGILVISTLAQQWQMRSVPGHRVELLPLINLRPRHGMAMTVHRRSTHAIPGLV